MSREDGEKRASPLGKRKLDALAMQMGDWEFYANGFRSRPLRRQGAVREAEGRLGGRGYPATQGLDGSPFHLPGFFFLSWY
jgi:hypothetical protein